MKALRRAYNEQRARGEVDRFMRGAVGAQRHLVFRAAFDEAPDHARQAASGGLQIGDVSSAARRSTA